MLREDAKAARRSLGEGGPNRHKPNEPMHYVYLLKSETEPKQIYVGLTTNLRARFSDHNAGRSPHTSKYRPWHLVCYHAFAEEQRAIDFETYLKSGSGRAFRRRHFGT